MSEYLVSFCISYLIGSFPTAYLVVQRTSHIDIRTVGSGNVGGRNALEVTGKKSVGAVVVAIDVLKGIIAVVFAVAAFNEPSVAISASMAGAVTGHCYPVWLRFKGGRGLATAAGVMLVTGWTWLVVWLALYYISSKTAGNVHLSSVIALVFTPVIAWLLPDVFSASVFLQYMSEREFFVAALPPLAVSLSRHIGPLKEYYVQNIS